VSGKVPVDIRGAFVKNGPNNQFSSELGRSHWFEGDGMLHAISIKDQKLYYCNRFTQTPRYKAELAAGKQMFPKLGELREKHLMIMPLMGLMEAIGYSAQTERNKGQTANTAMTQHAKRTYALVESDYPF